MSETSSHLPLQAPRPGVWRDRVGLAALAAAALAVGAFVDVHARLHRWAEEHERWDPYQLLPIVMAVAVVSVAHLVVTRRRLRRALEEIEVLSGLLAMCASCKRIRVEDDRWEPVEEYIQRRDEVSVTHGFCPDCAARLYPSRELSRILL